MERLGGHVCAQNLCLLHTSPTRTSVCPNPDALSSNALNIFPVLRFYPQGPILIPPYSHPASPLLPCSPLSDFSHFDRGKPKDTEVEKFGQAPGQEGRDKIQAVLLQSSGMSLNCFSVCGCPRDCAFLRVGTRVSSPTGKWFGSLLGHDCHWP